MYLKVVVWSIHGGARGAVAAAAYAEEAAAAVVRSRSGRANSWIQGGGASLVRWASRRKFARSLIRAPNSSGLLSNAVAERERGRSDRPAATQNA
jgi:hypothetical protein